VLGGQIAWHSAFKGKNVVVYDLHEERLAAYLPDHTLVATNSSTLLPSQFAETTGRPEKYCTLHFANLIWALNVCEIMAQPTAAEATLQAVHTGEGIPITLTPDLVANELRRKAMAFVCVHPPILSISGSLLVRTSTNYFTPIVVWSTLYY